MAMTVKERDQYETLKADWPVYDYSYDDDHEHPYRAVPLADRDAVLEADTPGELRDLVRADHLARTPGTTR